MSQMFSPFFLLLFYQALQKRQLHLFLLRNRQQDIFSGKQKKMRILYCCLHALQLSRRHAPPSRWNHPDIPKERKQEIPRRSFFGVALTMQPKKKSYICAIKNGRSNVQKKNQKLAHST